MFSEGIPSSTFAGIPSSMLGHKDDKVQALWQLGSVLWRSLGFRSLDFRFGGLGPLNPKPLNPTSLKP